MPLILGGVWQAVWLFVFAAAGTAKDPTVDKGIGKRELNCRSNLRDDVTPILSHDRQCLHVYFGICDNLGAWSLDPDW